MSKLRERLRDGAGVVGLISVSVGSAMIYLPAGLIVFGMFVIAYVAYDTWASD